MAPKTKFELSPLEYEAMAAIWDIAAGSVCVRDVLEVINATRKKKRRKQLAYNTVQTVMTLLKQKKAVKQVSDRGRAHYFAPCFSRGDASKHILTDLSQRLFGGQVTPLVHHLIEDAEMSENELAELRKWVEAKLKDVKSGRG